MKLKCMPFLEELVEQREISFVVGIIILELGMTEGFLDLRFWRVGRRRFLCVEGSRGLTDVV